MSFKFIYSLSEGNASMRELLGGRSANIGEAIKLNLSVPNGFTITTEASIKYFEDGKKISNDVYSQICEYTRNLNGAHGEKFGLVENPLLLSIHTNARFYMPGLMDTILFLGLNDEIAESLALKTGNAKYIYECYKDFVISYSSTVKGLSKNHFDEIVKNTCSNENRNDPEVNTLKNIILKCKLEYKQLTGDDFPSDPMLQLIGAVEAGFNSWDDPRANAYRRENDIPFALGTAITIQTVVYINETNESGYGVVHTRNPQTGAKSLDGEYIHGPNKKHFNITGTNEMSDLFPEVCRQIREIAETLEKHYRTIVEFHFVVHSNVVYVVRVLMSKLTAYAHINSICDFVDENLITPEQAGNMVSPQHIFEIKNDESLDNKTKENFARFYEWFDQYDFNGFGHQALARLTHATETVELDANDIDF